MQSVAQNSLPNESAIEILGSRVFALDLGANAPEMISVIEVTGLPRTYSKCILNLSSPSM